MDTSSPDSKHWPPVGTGLWTRWWGYLARWLLFGLVVSVFQPVGDGLGPWGPQKLYQALWGLLFGLACALVFTWVENTFNPKRVRWKTWLLVMATWLAVKVVFVSTMAMV